MEPCLGLTSIRQGRVDAVVRMSLIPFICLKLFFHGEQYAWMSTYPSCVQVNFCHGQEYVLIHV